MLLYLKKKDFLSKIFSFENSTILHAIENTLRNNNIQFIKRSEGGKVSQFPIKIVETFEIVDTQILIHVQKQTAMGTKVAVGPVRAENEKEIEGLLSKLDNEFLPKGL